MENKKQAVAPMIHSTSPSPSGICTAGELGHAVVAPGGQWSILGQVLWVGKRVLVVVLQQKKNYNYLKTNKKIAADCRKCGKLKILPRTETIVSHAGDQEQEVRGARTCPLVEGERNNCIFLQLFFGFFFIFSF